MISIRALLAIPEPTEMGVDLAYFSISRIAELNGVPESKFNWRRLAVCSQNLGVPIHQVPCEKWRKKNLYHKSVWQAVYPKARLPQAALVQL